MQLTFQPTVEVSVIAPMYNEKECVREFCSRVDAAMQRLTDSYEIIVVDDGSTDGTLDALNECALEYTSLRVVSLTRNSGQWAAVYAAIRHTRGVYVVVMDGDLQNPPEEIHLLVEEIRKGYDFVSGTRQKRSDGVILRQFPSRVANWLIRATTGCHVRDMGGFKCVRGDIARKLRLRAGQHRFLPALVHAMGGSISEVDVSFPPRFAGKSHYGLGRSLDVLFDIAMFWFQSSCKSRPLYLFGRISLSLFLFGSVVLTWLLFDKFVHNIDMGSRPPFIATVVIFLSAFGFLSVGFVLEILSDMFDAVLDRTPYRVKSSDSTMDTNDPVVRRAA